MKSPDSRDQDELFSAVKVAISLVDGGMTPDAAVEKVARDNSFGPGKIKLVCNAYNTGRSTAQFAANKSILDKLASFDLADYERVTQAVYGSHEKTSAAQDIDPSYSLPPPWLDSQRMSKLAATGAHVEKQAAAKPTPEVVLDRSLLSAQLAKRAVEENRRLLSDAQDKLIIKVAELARYFRSFPQDRLSFDVVEKTAATYYGPLAVTLLDGVYSHVRSREKRAGDCALVLDNPIDLNAPPFTIIRDCIKIGNDLGRLRNDFNQATVKSAQAEEAVLVPFAGAGQPPLPRTALCCPELDKQAGLLPAAVGATMGSMFARSLGDMPKSRGDLVDDAVGSLESPAHQNELRKIRNMVMLNNMMTDPDDPISGEAPDRVLRTFNEISQMTPRLADQPAALRPALRRQLAGKTEPFEAKEMTDIEKGLAGIRLPSSNIFDNANAPGSR